MSENPPVVENKRDASWIVSCILLIIYSLAAVFSLVLVLGDLSQPDAMFAGLVAYLLSPVLVLSVAGAVFNALYMKTGKRVWLFLCAIPMVLVFIWFSILGTM